MSRFAALMFCCVLFITGCGRSDGDRLARIGRMVTGKVQSLVPNRTPFNGPLAVPGGDRIDVRVKSRLKADKYLATFAIEVIAEGNNIRLQGSVSEEPLKRRAVELAESTTGVEQVIDELKIE